MSAECNGCGQDGCATFPDCSCDEAKAWRERALRAEAKLDAMRPRLVRLLGDVDAVLALACGAPSSEDASERGSVLRLRFDFGQVADLDSAARRAGLCTSAWAKSILLGTVGDEG